MRQQLENIGGMYQPMQMQRTISDRPRVYTIGDLESLSATVLYSGKITIRPLGLNSSLHIHEGEGGTAHIKTRDNQYQNLSSYQAAMMDLLLDKAKMPKIQK